MQQAARPRQDLQEKPVSRMLIESNHNEHVSPSPLFPPAIQNTVSSHGHAHVSKRERRGEKEGVGGGGVLLADATLRHSL